MCYGYLGEHHSLREGQEEFTKEPKKGKLERLVEDREGSEAVINSKKPGKVHSNNAAHTLVTEE